MERCPPGSTRIGRGLALRLLDWHGGQGSMLYAAGSTGFAGHCVPKRVLFDASMELRREHRAVALGPHAVRRSKDVRALRAMADVLRRRALPYEGSG